MGCVGGISRAEGVRGDAKLEAVKELPPRLYLGRIALGALQDVMLLALPDNLFRLLDSEGKPRLARLSISRSFESVSELANRANRNSQFRRQGEGKAYIV